MPMNSDVRKVKIYACKKATNSSSRLRATIPSTLLIVTVAHSAGCNSAVSLMKNRIVAVTMWPANMLAKRRIASTPLRTSTPMISRQKTSPLIGMPSGHAGRSICGQNECR